MSRFKRNESIEKESLTVGVLLSPRENLVNRSLYDYKEIKILQVNNNHYSLRYIREDSTYVDNANFSYKNINDKFVLKDPVLMNPLLKLMLLFKLLLLRVVTISMYRIII